MLRMFSVRQPFPLLIAARRNLGDGDFAGLMRAVVVISFRYNVIGNLQTSEQERTYHAEADRISKGEHLALSQILEGLRPVYPADEPFRAAFAEKSIGTTQARNRRVVRYILCKLERQKSGADLDFLSDTLSVEHICPTNPEGGWSGFTDEEVETLASRLGNMTLLQSGQNNHLGNAEYVVKRPVYAASAYALTRDVAAQNSDWTPERIATRQKELARLATAIWRVAQLG
jgi:hypothetical protein